MSTLLSSSIASQDLAWTGFDRYNRPRYSVTETASYLGVSASTLRTWVDGRQFDTSSGRAGFSEPLIQRPNESSGDVSFVNVVEAHILQVIKVDHEVPPAEVRNTLDYLCEELQSEHPLIEYEFTTHGKALFVKQLDKLLSGADWGQWELLPMLEDKLRDVEWRDGRLYRLFPKSSKTNRLIVMNPALSSGRPVVQGSGVLASMISRRHNRGESIETLARDYRIDPKAVTAAIDFATAA